MRYFLLALVFFVLACPTRSEAIPAFRNRFRERYTPRPNTEFAQTIRRLNCKVCHLESEDRDHLNGYALQLQRWLNAERDVADIKRIDAVLRHVERLPIYPDQEGSPTYGDMFIRDQ